MARDIGYDYQLPTQTDDGDTWGQILETAINRLVHHQHNGDDSAILTATMEKDRTYYNNAWSHVDNGVKQYYEKVIVLNNSTDIESNHVRDIYLVNGTYNNNTSVTNITEKILINPEIIWTKSDPAVAHPDTMAIRILDPKDNNGVNYNLLMVSY